MREKNSRSQEKDSRQKIARKISTVRGCHNHCWVCFVPKREGTLRELPITDGWTLLDNNILVCSEKHIRAVFDMLKRQKYRPQFTGRIEAKLLQSWHIDLFQQVKPKQIFFVYDTPDDLPPLEHAAYLFREADYGNRNILRYYVLIGYTGVIRVILSTSPLKDWKLRRLSVSALWPCFIAERSTEISKVILLQNGAEPNVLGLDLLPSTLLTGTTLFCFELYSVFASLCTRFSVNPEHFAIPSIVNLPSSKKFSAILSFSCSTASCLPLLKIIAHY